MNKLIAVLIILVITGCQSREPRPGKFKTLMIKSVGEVETLPDVASFRIQLTCLNQSIKSSKQCLIDKSNELNNKLLAFGISKEDILTSSVDMNKSYTWNRSTRIFEGYISSTVVYVKVKDLNKLDEIYTELLENRNLEISGLSYSHSNLDSLKNEAYLNALKSSNVLADKLVNELPESKKEIIKIGNVEISSSLPESAKFTGDEMMAETSVAVRNQSVAISKGTVSVMATLYVEYQIK